MNPEIKVKWLEALRSGEYKQGTYYLKNDDKYCCLGVLCDLASKEIPLKCELSGRHSVYAYDDGGCKQTQDLPDAVVTWAGLGSSNPRVYVPGICDDKMELSICNDQYRYGFVGIAKLIENSL